MGNNNLPLFLEGRILAEGVVRLMMTSILVAIACGNKVVVDQLPRGWNECQGENPLARKLGQILATK